MSRRKELHGAAFQKSRYVSTAAFWVHHNPRISAGKLRKKLIDHFGMEASFSEPHLQAWMTNYYPEIIKAAFEAEGDDRVGQMVVSLSESKLFGQVADPLDYHQKMIFLLETRMQEVEAEYEANYRIATEPSASSEDRAILGVLCMKLRDQIIKFSKEIREYKEFIDEWQRVHDVGERLGDLMYRMVELAFDLMMPEVPAERRVELRQEFANGYKRIARDFKIPIEKVYGG